MFPRNAQHFSTLYSLFKKVKHFVSLLQVALRQIKRDKHNYLWIRSTLPYLETGTSVPLWECGPDLQDRHCTGARGGTRVNKNTIKFSTSFNLLFFSWFTVLLGYCKHLTDFSIMTKLILATLLDFSKLLWSNRSLQLLFFHKNYFLFPFKNVREAYLTDHDIFLLSQSCRLKNLISFCIYFHRRF